jgi:phosphoribosylanthranilate isomerase
MHENQETTKKKHRPQVKICGLTRVKEALECTTLSVDAIGCVFYPKSPRNLTDNQAKEICSAVKGQIKTVGVFVNETFSNIMKRVNHCRLSTVQLHGQESSELVQRFRKEKIQVIKALFVEGTPSLEDVSSYNASAYLVECGRGNLPGGIALKWDWEKAKSFGENHPLIIAGGLAPENVSHAIWASAPHAVDVSSGVERSPGLKDLGKIKAFMDAVSQSTSTKKLKKVF